MNWPVALSGGEGFCVVPILIKMLVSIDGMVLRQGTSNCLIASIIVHDCLLASIELSKYGS